MSQWNKTNILCVHYFLFCVSTHTQSHTHIHCDPHVDRSKSKAALASINRLIHEISYTLVQLYVCVSWPVFNFPLMWPDCLWVSPLMWLVQRHQWVIGFTGASWIWLLLLIVSAGGGARVSYHASTWTGRQIHCVRQSGEHSGWCAHSMVCCMNTQ